MLRLMLSESWAEKHASPIGEFLPDIQHYTCGTTIALILQIHTQIPAIQISSSGHQLYQLFKILTSREAENPG